MKAKLTLLLTPGGNAGLTNSSDGGSRDAIPPVHREVDPVDSPSDSAPTALADLIAAGLVSHEMIGDPGRLGGEAEALRTLCGLVAGPIWRIAPFHYAFADPGDPDDRAAALAAALAAELGPEAAFVTATEPPEAAAPEAPLLLLRAHGRAVLEAAGPELTAIVGARFAAEAARLATAADAGPLAARLAAIETRQAALLAAVEAQAAGIARLAETVGRLIERLEAQAGTLEAHIAREDLVAGRLAELAAIAGAPAAFQETLGVTLAEFLAQLERRAAEAPSRVPQFS
jgi:hypothetical protein